MTAFARFVRPWITREIPPLHPIDRSSAEYVYILRNGQEISEPLYKGWLLAHFTGVALFNACLIAGTNCSKNKELSEPLGCGSESQVDAAGAAPRQFDPCDDNFWI